MIASQGADAPSVVDAPERKVERSEEYIIMGSEFTRVTVTKEIQDAHAKIHAEKLRKISEAADKLGHRPIDVGTSRDHGKR